MRIPTNRLLAAVVLVAAAAGAAVSAGAAPVIHPLQQEPAGRTQNPQSAAALAYTDRDWSVYTTAVNVILCRAVRGDEVWLGTTAGVKLVDRQTGSVRHYTAADGLPDTPITAIQAVGDSVWCVAPVGDGKDSSFVLSRLRGTSTRWEMAARVPRDPEPRGGDIDGWTPRLYGCLLVAAEGYVCIAPTPVRRERAAVGYICDRDGRVQAVPWDPATRADHPELYLSFAVATGDTIRFGTQLGLLHYELRGRAWKRELPRRSLNAIANGRNESWIANLDRDEPAGFNLTRLDHTGKVADYRIPTDRAQFPQSDPPGGVPTGVDIIGDRVWVTMQALRNAYGAAFYELDPAAGTWRTVVPKGPADAENAPVEVFAHSRGHGQPLLTHLAPSRLASWFCAEDKLPPPVRRASSRSRPVMSEGKTIWRLDGKGNLERTHSEQPAPIRYPLPPIPGIDKAVGFVAGLTPMAVWVAVRDPRDTAQAALRFDRATQEWKVWGPDSGFPQGGMRYELTTDGEGVWAFGGDGVARFDPAADRWEDLSAAVGGEAAVQPEVESVIVEERQVWMLARGGKLVDKYGKRKPAPAHLLTRWDRQTGKMSAFDPDELPRPAGEAILAEADAIWLQTSGGPYRFDRRAETWQRLLPPVFPPRRISGGAPAVIRHEGSIWFTGNGNYLRYTAPAPR